GARSYEPQLGVWLSPDPILDQYMRGAPNGGVYEPIHLGVYTYTRNNPLMFVDPTGLAEKCVDGVCQAFVAPEEVSTQTKEQRASGCISESCMSPVARVQHWQEIDRARNAAEDKPLEAPLIDPIDAIGVAGTAVTLVRVGAKLALGKLASKVISNGGATIFGEGTLSAAASKVLQTGGNKFNSSTARGLNEALGMDCLGANGGGRWKG
ncbi:RHS repeat-associated core domain-containing protein, partial [Sorangium cellulosum]|uniref:RHS repeat-associated core domain-containing protein n=1 Tax=Sorangium cellulosum TaxID=56 RepID=UPI000A97634B